MSTGIETTGLCVENYNFLNSPEILLPFLFDGIVKLLFSSTGFPLLQEFSLVLLFEDGSSSFFILPYVTLAVVDGCMLGSTICVLLYTLPATFNNVAVIELYGRYLMRKDTSPY